MHLLHSQSRPLWRAARFLPFLAALMAVAACNPDDTGTGLSNAFTIKTRATTDSFVVAKGNTLSIPLAVTRGGGYLDAVTFAIDTLMPAGVTASVSPQALAVDNTVSILTINADATAVEGVDSLMLYTSGFDVPIDTLKIRFTVVSPAIAVTPGTTSVNATVGGSASIPITVQRLNGYTGAVTLVAEGVPDNVTATFTPALIPNGLVSSTLTLTPLAGAVASTQTITLRAKGIVPGVTEKTSPFAFTIVGSATADYLPSASTAALAIVGGASTQTVISLNRTGGFASNVSFALTGLPAGVTAAFAPNPATANSTTLTLTSTTATAVGTYNLVLTGTAAGTAPHSIPLVLTVNVPLAVNVTLLSPTVTVAKGSVGQTGVVVMRLGGLVGDIALTSDALPTGVTGTFAPAILTGNGNTSVVTISASSAAASGTYPIVIRGTNAATSVVGTTTITIIVQ